MDKTQLQYYICRTAGMEPEAVSAVCGGLSAADKFRVRLRGEDWMVKIVPGTPIREMWYRELDRRASDTMAVPRMYKLFEDGMLCLISPWIEGESLEACLKAASREQLEDYGRQAAQILLTLHQLPFDYPAYASQLSARVNSACDQVEQLELTFPGHEKICAYLRETISSYSADHVCFVHKDVRPENFIVRGGRLYLIDFDNGSLGERAADFSYLTTMGGEQFYPFSREVLRTYLAEADDVAFWEKNLLYSTLQMVEYAIWKYKVKGKQVKLQAENLCAQYDWFSRMIPAWWNDAASGV